MLRGDSLSCGKLPVPHMPVPVFPGSVFVCALLWELCVFSPQCYSWARSDCWLPQLSPDSMWVETTLGREVCEKQVQVFEIAGCKHTSVQHLALSVNHIGRVWPDNGCILLMITKPHFLPPQELCTDFSRRKTAESICKMNGDEIQNHRETWVWRNLWRRLV